MLILLLLTLIIFQTIIGMYPDPNPDVTISSCWESCPGLPDKVCPKRCEYYLTAGKEICWKCFCKICIAKFGDIFQLNFEEGSSSNWQQNVGLDEGQSSSSSQIIPSLEEGQASSSQIIPLGNFLQSLKEQINSTILEQIQELLSNDKSLNRAINQNIYKIGRNDDDDVKLFSMFNERILKHFLSLCRLFTSSNQHAEQTDALCTKAYRINRSFENIRSQHPNIYYQSHIEFENLAKYIREPYYEKISVCKNLPNKRYNELEYEIYSRINFNQNWGVNIKNLDAHINEQLKNGIKNLLRYKAYKACKRYLPGFMYESNIKNVLLEIMSPEIPQLEPQITEIACKSTIAISQMCQYGEFVNCHSLKPALSIFAVELFITAIDAEGFDHLLGKWPFAMSNYYFDGGESSVQ